MLSLRRCRQQRMLDRRLKTCQVKPKDIAVIGKVQGLGFLQHLLEMLLQRKPQASNLERQFLI
jgi:hypothetical protein